MVQGRSYGRPEAAREVLVAVEEADLLRESADILEPDVFPPEEAPRRNEH